MSLPFVVAKNKRPITHFGAQQCWDESHKLHGDRMMLAGLKYPYMRVIP